MILEVGFRCTPCFTVRQIKPRSSLSKKQEAGHVLKYPCFSKHSFKLQLIFAWLSPFRTSNSFDNESFFREIELQPATQKDNHSLSKNGGTRPKAIIHVCYSFVFHSPSSRKPQVITSCQQSVLMRLAFIPELWLAARGPCTSCLSPKDTSTTLLHAQSGSDWGRKCCFLVYQLTPHVSFNVWERHSAAHRWFYSGDKDVLLHHKSGDQIILYFSSCMCIYIPTSCITGRNKGTTFATSLTFFPDKRQKFGFMLT